MPGATEGVCLREGVSSVLVLFTSSSSRGGVKVAVNAGNWFLSGQRTQ